MRVTIQTADVGEARRMLDAGDMVSVLREHTEWLRQQIKYNDKSALEEARDHLWQLMADYRINLEEM